MASDDEELRTRYGPDGKLTPDPTPTVEVPLTPDPTPTVEVPAVADEVAAAAPGEPIVSWELGGDGAPAPAGPVEADNEPVPPVVAEPPQDRTPLVEAVLAAVLVGLFFTPWFSGGEWLSSSGAGFVAWLDSYLSELPRSAFGREMLLPYLAVLIPIGAVIVLAFAVWSRPSRLLAVTTALVAPVLLMWGAVRAPESIFKVLEVGAYLTLVCSLALLVVALFGTRSGWTRRLMLAAFVALLVGAVVIPQAAQDKVDSPLFAAFSRGETSLDEAAPASGGTTPSSGTSQSDSSTSPAVTVPDTVVPSDTASTVAATPTTVAAASPTPARPTAGCPSGRPFAEVTRFAYEQQSPGSSTYTVDVEGQIVNRTSAAADVTSVSFVVVQAGTQVGGDTVEAGRTVFANGSMQFWSRGLVIQSPGGAPSDAQVTSLVYGWNDSGLAACAR